MILVNVHFATNPNITVSINIKTTSKELYDRILL